VPRLLNVTDIFQLIMNGLNQGALAQEPCVPQTHHAIFHVLAEFGEQCEPLAQEEVMQGLRNVASIPTELPTPPGRESRDRAAIVDMAWRHPQGQQFTLVIDDERQFEAVEPPPRGLPSRGYALKDCVGGNPVVVTDSQRR
jgi:hypothetical protein